MTARAVLIWVVLGLTVGIPLLVAATSPLLQWRDGIYIVAGFAGVVGLAIMLFQPLLVAGDVPGFPAARGRRVHRWLGISLIFAIVLHVGGLWLTSPPDVIDALVFNSATPFSAWGVIAMWAAFAAAMVAFLRRRIGVRIWRVAHSGLVSVVVVGTVVHALLIEGTMGTVSKAALCLLVVAVTAKTVAERRAWTALRRRR